LGEIASFEGSLGTQVVKIFDWFVAHTGLRDREAIKAGFCPITIEKTACDHKAYYPGAQELHVRITGDRHSGQLLGAQLLGHKDSEVSKRIDIFATALFHKMTVESLNDLDLSYTPPLSSPWDPVQMGAQAWQADEAIAERSPNVGRPQIAKCECPSRRKSEIEIDVPGV